VFNGEAKRLDDRMSLLKSRANDAKSSAKNVPLFGGKWEQREYGGGGITQSKTSETDSEILAMEQRLQVTNPASLLSYV
jgi:hypothetical protein